MKALVLIGCDPAPFTWPFDQRNEVADLLILWGRTQVTVPIKFINQHMRISIVFFLIIAVFQTAVSQDISELEKRNGFKDIKLGMIADSVKGVKFKKDFKERDEFPAKLYAVEHPDFARIGEVKVDRIEVKAYKDL